VFFDCIAVSFNPAPYESGTNIMAKYRPAETVDSIVIDEPELGDGQG